MEKEGKAPELIRLMYGEQAEAMSEVAGERLQRWAQGFEEWLGKMHGRRGPRRRGEARLAWQYFTRSYRGAPWAASTADVDKWVSELLQRGMGCLTVRAHLRYVRLFYCYMSENTRDPELETGFNPAKGAVTPSWRPYENANSLTPEAARALLEGVERESSLVGKRDYAMLLLALRSGLEGEYIRGLKWGSLKREGEGARLGGARLGGARLGGARLGGDNLPAARPAENPPPAYIPGEAWKAILNALEAAGRLAGIQPEEYVFAPAADALGAPPCGNAEDWDGSRPISRVQMHSLLKKAAQRAGLEGQRITWLTLRHTAVLLLIEEGAEPEEVQRQMGMANLKKTKFYIDHISQGHRLGLPGQSPESGPQTPSTPHTGNPGFLKHGYYAKSLPPEEMANLEAHPREGLGEEIDLTRFVLRSTVELLLKAQSDEEKLHVIEVFCKATAGLGRLTRVEHTINPEPNRAEEELAEDVRAVAEITGWDILPH